MSLNKKLQKDMGRDFSLTPYGEIEKAQQELLPFRPEKPNHLMAEYDPSDDKAVAVVYSLVLPTFLIAPSFATLVITSIASWQVMGIVSLGAYAICSISYSLATAHVIHAGKIRNFLYKIFFTKKKRKRVEKSIRKITEYEEAKEAFTILVQQKENELRRMGVYEEQAEDHYSGSFYFLGDDGRSMKQNKTQWLKDHGIETNKNAEIKQKAMEQIIKNYHKEQEQIKAIDSNSSQ